MAPPVYFLLHVPKTAGQTIIWALETRASEVFANVDTSGGRAKLRGDTSRIRAISGHRLAKRMEAAFPARELRRTVLLRPPADLLLSLYNFRMLSYRAKGLGTYSFDLHLNALPRNFMSQFLLAGWLGLGALERRAMTDTQVFERLSAELASFWFVGAHSDCDRLWDVVGREVGVEGPARRRNTEAEWREQVDWTPLRREGLTPAQAARIAADHPVDQALWETWAGAGFAARDVRPAPFVGAERGRLVRPALHEAARLVLREAAAPFQAARVARADAARTAEDWPRAARLYRRALDHASGSPALWLQYARALRAAGRTGDAAAAYREALQNKPDFPTAAAELAGL